MQKVRAMMKEARLTERYSGNTVFYTVYLYNRTTNITLQENPPCELLVKAALNNYPIRKFGFAAYLHAQEAARKSELDDNPPLVVYLTS